MSHNPFLRKESGVPYLVPTGIDISTAQENSPILCQVLQSAWTNDNRRVNFAGSLSSARSSSQLGDKSPLPFNIVLELMSFAHIVISHISGVVRLSIRGRDWGGIAHGLHLWGLQICCLTPSKTRCCWIDTTYRQQSLEAKFWIQAPHCFGWSETGDPYVVFEFIVHWNPWFPLAR